MPCVIAQAPRINSIAPTMVRANADIVLTGIKFGTAYASQNKIIFTGSDGKIYTIPVNGRTSVIWTDTWIKFRMSVMPKAGVYKLHVEVNGIASNEVQVIYR